MMKLIIKSHNILPLSVRKTLFLTRMRIRADWCLSKFSKKKKKPRLDFEKVFHTFKTTYNFKRFPCVHTDNY